MKQQIINISDFEYLVELYDVETDIVSADVVYDNYYILRNISFIDNIAYDTDIYFIEKNIYEKIKNSNSEVTEYVAFPCHNSKFGSFSQSYVDFSNILNKKVFKSDSEGGSVFNLFNLKYKYEYDENGKETIKQDIQNASIKCDKYRIYHPHNKVDLNYIIYLDNVINGIHFHYFCNYNSNCKINSETEKVVNNKRYSEFIEFYVPNINYLFTKHKETTFYNQDGKIDYIIDNNIYFNDFYNITKYIDIENYKRANISEENWISIKSEHIKNLSENPETMSYIPFYLFLNPFITYSNEIGLSEKVYYKMGTHDCNNYNSLPINITLYPFEKSEINSMLLAHNKYISNSDTFTKDYYFTLVSKLGFSHNKLCVINTFNYINAYNEITNPNGLTLAEAYAKYNGLSEPIWAYEEKGIIKECITDDDYLKEDKFQISKEYTIFKKNKQESIDAYHKENKNNKYAEIELEEIEEESQIYCCGYQIDVSANNSFTNIIASDYIETPFITDFDFSLVNLFNDWYSLPNTLIIRVKYIDKYLGVSLNTGFIILNKEWIKYSINNTNTVRLFDDFINKQNDLSNMGIWNSNTIDAEKTTFNFIDKINCIVDKTANNNIELYGNSNTKIIYKPIFYRTQDLQNISIKNGLKQKIGINLASYMTKVNSFKIIIDNKEITEFGRNDIYVIFEINANLLTKSSGVYSIVDSSDNYISSGNWYTI